MTDSSNLRSHKGMHLLAETNLATRITHSHGPLTLTLAGIHGRQESDGNIKHSLLKILLASRRRQLTMAKLPASEYLNCMQTTALVVDRGRGYQWDCPEI